MAYLTDHLSQTDGGYVQTLSNVTDAIKNYTIGLGDAAQAATGYIYQTLIAQAGLLAYTDIFLGCAVISFAFIPFTFLFSPVKVAGGPGGH